MSALEAREPFWKKQHPYMAPEGNFFANRYQLEDYCHEFENWDEFLAELGTMDEDYNLLYRWDYVEHDPDDFEPEEYEEPPANYLAFCYILQRRGTFLWVRILEPKLEDEERIRAYLEARWSYFKKLWEPLN